MTPTDRDEFVEDCIRAMGTELGSVFGPLSKELWELKHERSTYIALFAHNSGDVVPILNSAAPDFFGLTQSLLFNSIALRIARITDPATSDRGRQENLTLERLGGLLGKNVADAAANARAAAWPFRVWRNKVIAHSDFATATQGFPDHFTNGQLSKVESAIEGCIQLAGQQYNFVIASQQGWTDVGSLIKHLRAAKPELERRRKLEDELIGF